MNIGYFKHKTKACGFDNMVFHLVRYMCWIQIMYTCLDNILPIKDIFFQEIADQTTNTLFYSFQSHWQWPFVRHCTFKQILENDSWLVVQPGYYHIWVVLICSVLWSRSHWVSRVRDIYASLSSPVSVVASSQVDIPLDGDSSMRSTIENY